jgi:DNA-binding MarR family transcriptional regulator
LSVTRQDGDPDKLGRTVDYPLGSGLDFLRHIWQLSHALEKLSMSMDQRLGVTAPQRLLLRCVGKYPGVSAGQLAAVLHLDPGTVSAALKRLEKKKLLERRKDPRDRRRVSLGLTAAGRALDLPRSGTVESAVERLLETVNGGEIAVALRVLEQLAHEVENELILSQNAT